METNKIQELVFSFLDSIGAKTVQEPENVYHSIIPSEEKSFFNGSENYSFVFDRALAEMHRELELICEGSYILKKIIERLSSIPKVSRLFKVCEPELPTAEPGKGTELRVLTPGKVHYRQKVVFTFKVSFLCDQRHDMLYSILADPANHEIYLKEGIEEIDLSQYKETPDPSYVIEESGEDMLRLYLHACRKMEENLETKIVETKSKIEIQLKQELVNVEEYLNEQKRELQQKKENVCFHLYFFQKEEEIDKMIRDLESEHNRKIGELKEKFRLKVEINLLNAIVLCVPTLGVSASFLTRKKKEGLLAHTQGNISGEMGSPPAI